MHVQSSHEPPLPNLRPPHGGASDRLAWHYTTGHCASQILQSGVILPATGGVPRHEIPAVWFSLNQCWEPTATKGITNPKTGIRRDATMEEMERMAGGCYRFGMEPTRLLRWSALKLRTGMRPKTVRGLERVAYQVGANPLHWMGAIGPVDLGDVLVFQRRIDGVWVTDPEGLGPRSFASARPSQQ